MYTLADSHYSIIQYHNPEWFVAKSDRTFFLNFDIFQIFASHHVRFHTEVEIVKFTSVKGRLHELEMSNGETLVCDVCIVTEGLLIYSIISCSFCAVLSPVSCRHLTREICSENL
jgi:hypothetical protein